MDNRIVAVVEPEGTGKPDDAEWGKIQSFGKEGSHDPIMWKNFYSNILSQQEVATKFDQMEKTDGDKSPRCREYIYCSRVFAQAKPLGAIPAGTIIGPISEVLIVKILDEYGVEVAIPSKCKPGDVTYVVISTETERFVVEIPTHAAKTRSSRELLEHLQESKENMFLQTKRGNH